MNEYSKITSIHLQNFMSHSDTTVTFDESNIIDLCGYNDSGKTAIGYALDVLLYDGSPTLQGSYIKEGETFFNVGLNFDDGVSITKTKDDTGKSIWTMTKDGVIIYTNKRDTSIVAVDGVPQEIAKYLGVVYDETTEQKLNIRTKRDKALLTETTGGENYKMFSTICNSEVLSEASKAMTERKNKLNQEIATKATTLTAYHNQYLGMDAPSDEVLDVLHELTEKARGISSQERNLSDINKILDSMSEIVIPEELSAEALNEKRKQVELLRSIYDLNVSLDISVYPELRMCDSTQLKLIAECIKLYTSIDNNIIPEVHSCNSSALKDIVGVIQNYNAYCKQYRDYILAEDEFTKRSAELKALCVNNNIRICKNCGTAITDEGVGHEHV